MAHEQQLSTTNNPSSRAVACNMSLNAASRPAVNPLPRDMAEDSFRNTDIMQKESGVTALHSAVVQRKIRYTKSIKNEDDLRKLIKSMYEGKHAADIDKWVDEARDASFSLTANELIDQIREHASLSGWKKDVPVTTLSKNHGPQLPVKESGKNIAHDPRSAMSAFMFGSVTLARADVTLPDGNVVSFEGRNRTDDGTHAEDELMEKIGDYFKKGNIKSEACSFRVTINNLTCHIGANEKNCAATISKFAQKMRFKKAHLYFTTSFGENPAGAIKTLQQDGGFKVSSFNPKVLNIDTTGFGENLKKKIEEKEEPRIGGADLDPWSESEGEEEDPKSSSKSNKRKAITPESKTVINDKSKKIKNNNSVPKPVAQKDDSDSQGLDHIFCFASKNPPKGDCELDVTQSGMIHKLFGDMVGKKVTWDDELYIVEELKKKVKPTDFNKTGVMYRLKWLN